ncbi:DUF333 domain-containing protein [Halomonas elongata]|uniref:putative hemolysin n=1 Tax=Halomonas elongata TaxID=2746 RepID=UPI0038D3C7AC
MTTIARTWLVGAGVALLAACAAHDEEPKADMVNPASVYCKEQGGTLEIQQNADGQYGMCTLPDGSQIEEWDLYRRDHPSK